MRKVKCINRGNYLAIQEGQIYNVSQESDTQYNLDFGDGLDLPAWYEKELFGIVDEPLVDEDDSSHPVDFEELHPELSILGAKINRPDKTLECFPAPQRVSKVVFETDEITSNCPKTGQPDFYKLILTYYPNKLCLESKALKLYLWSFRDSGQFIEELAQIMVEDFVKVLEPVYLKVDLKMAARGGITIQAEAQYHRGLGEEWLGDES